MPTPYSQSRGRVLATSDGLAVSAGNPLAVSDEATAAIATTLYTEDIAAAANPVGPAVILVRRDTLTTAEVTTDGDNVSAKANSRGQLHVDAAGGVASGATDSGNPVKVGGVYNSTLPTLTTGQRGDVQLSAKGIQLSTLYTSGGAAFNDLNGAGDGASTAVSGLVVRAYATVYDPTAASWTRLRGDASGIATQPNALTASRWVYAAAAAGISNTTTAVTVAAAGGASIRNYVAGMQIFSTALTAASEICVRDGAGGAVLWRGYIGTAGLIGGLDIQFPSPLKGTANTLLEIVTLTASVAGTVWWNLEGFTGA